MIYICVRTYGDGHYQNKIFPQVFKHYGLALTKCAYLNKIDVDDSDEKWIPFPMYSED